MKTYAEIVENMKLQGVDIQPTDEIMELHNLADALVNLNMELDKLSQVIPMTEDSCKIQMDYVKMREVIVKTARSINKFAFDQSKKLRMDCLTL